MTVRRSPARRRAPLRPESPRWRWCVLNALDLVSVWGVGPVTQASWAHRYRPGVQPATAARAWMRMIEGLREVGVGCRSTPTGGTCEERVGLGGQATWELWLEPGALLRVAQLERALDDWLVEQRPLSRERAKRLDWEIKDRNKTLAKRRDRRAS